MDKKNQNFKTEQFFNQEAGVRVMAEIGGIYLWSLEDGVGVCLADYFDESDEANKLEDELSLWN